MPDKPRIHDPNSGITLALLWLATTVIAIAGFVILSTTRIFEDHIGLDMPNTLSRGAGWFFVVAWITASGAIIALGRGPRSRVVSIGVLVTYFAGMTLILLEFLSTIWAVTWSLT